MILIAICNEQMKSIIISSRFTPFKISLNLYTNPNTILIQRLALSLYNKLRKII